MPQANPVQLQRFLQGVAYPASKAELLRNARGLGADDIVCSSLERLPDDEFRTPSDVTYAVGRLSDLDD